MTYTLALKHLFWAGAFLGHPVKNWSSSAIATIGRRGDFTIINLHYCLLYLRHFLYVNKQYVNRVYSTCSWIAAHRVEAPKKYFTILPAFEEYFFVCPWWLYGLVSNFENVIWNILIESSKRMKIKKGIGIWAKRIVSAFKIATKRKFVIWDIKYNIKKCKKFMYLFNLVIYREFVSLPRSVFVVNNSESAQIHSEGVAFKTPIYAAASTWIAHNYLYIPSNDYNDDTSKFFLTLVKNQFYKILYMQRQFYYNRMKSQRVLKRHVLVQ